MVGCDTFCRLHRSRTPLDLTTFEPDLGALSHLSLHCDGLLPAKELAEELKLARSEGARRELELARAVDLTALGRSLGRSRLTDLDLLSYSAGRCISIFCDLSYSAGRCISIFVDARDSGHFAFLFLAIELRGFVVRVSRKQRVIRDALTLLLEFGAPFSSCLWPTTVRKP